MFLNLNNVPNATNGLGNTNLKSLYPLQVMASRLALVFMLGFGISSSAYSLEIIDLGPNITPKDINNNGTVVGSKITDSTKPWASLEAFRWTRSGGYETLNSVYSVANAINDNEQIAGDTRTNPGQPQVPFSYFGNTLNVIGTGTDQTAQGINQLGQIAGSQEKINPFGRPANGENPAIYDLNTQSWSVADITTFYPRGRVQGVYAGRMRLIGINDSGIAIGNETRSGLIYSDRPFILLPDTQTAEFLPVGVGSQITAINNQNHMVGGQGSRFTNSRARAIYGRAFFYDYNNADFVDLGTLSEAETSVSRANDINESDQVVGTSTLFTYKDPNNLWSVIAERTTHAFIWENGAMTDLNDLIPPNTGWVLVSATAINDNGDILGLGINNGVTHGYVLDAGSIGQPPATVNQAPVANVNTDITSGDVTLTVNFIGSNSYDSDGSVVDYSWDFGDGSVSNAANPSHNYTNSGQFTTILTVTDNEGKTNSASTIITVTDPNTGSVDKLSVKNAIYNSKRKRIRISATSDAAPGSENITVIAVTNGVERRLGTLRWETRRQDYRKVFKRVRVAPDSIILHSDQGGTVTHLVWIR